MIIIAGNWKMNTTVSEAVELVRAMKGPLNKVHGIEKVLCPPFISLEAIRPLLEGTTIKLGAQNLHFEPKGAFTGEISPNMLSGLCEYVIVGHSERRLYFGETDQIINRKLKAAFAAGLKPILCVGEGLEERENKKSSEVVMNQTRRALEGVGHLNGLTIAYEPVWAIGTGRAATGAIANETTGMIRQVLAGLYLRDAARRVPILYGGSVTPENVAEFLSQPEIQGALVGGASLNARSFVAIVERAARFKPEQK